MQGWGELVSYAHGKMTLIKLRTILPSYQFLSDDCSLSHPLLTWNNLCAKWQISSIFL